MAVEEEASRYKAFFVDMIYVRIRVKLFCQPYDPYLPSEIWATLPLGPCCSRESPLVLLFIMGSEIKLRGD